MPFSSTPAFSHLSIILRTTPSVFDPLARAEGAPDSGGAVVLNDAAGTLEFARDAYLQTASRNPFSASRSIAAAIPVGAIYMENRAAEIGEQHAHSLDHILADADVSDVPPRQTFQELARNEATLGLDQALLGLIKSRRFRARSTSAPRAAAGVFTEGRIEVIKLHADGRATRSARRIDLLNRYFPQMERPVADAAVSSIPSLAMRSWRCSKARPAWSVRSGIGMWRPSTDSMSATDAQSTPLNMEIGGNTGVVVPHTIGGENRVNAASSAIR
jgi:hypothetical protein